MTIEEIRDELRDAIFFTLFHTCAAGIEGMKSLIEVGRQKAIGFIEFGVNARLITPEEGNEWLDAVWDRTPSGVVWEKYKGAA